MESSEAIVHMVVDYAPALPAPHAAAAVETQAQAQAQAQAATGGAGRRGGGAPANERRGKPKRKQRQKSKSRSKTKAQTRGDADERSDTREDSGAELGGGGARGGASASASASASAMEAEYRFDRSDGYAYDPTSAAALQEAVEQSSVPLHEMPAHRPVDEETGFGLDIGMNGILASHVEPMDASFRSLRVYERDYMKNYDYWMPEVGHQGGQKQKPLPTRKKAATQRATRSANACTRL